LYGQSLVLAVKTIQKTQPTAIGVIKPNTKGANKVVNTYYLLWMIKMPNFANF
jgi:hypothetical protein